ncbi:MAG TPA: amidohydrolase family protein [Nitrososphaeraceae archaeon]|nr:amidohydrolase family protein [Nitrososphaeraceae archaeon]
MENDCDLLIYGALGVVIPRVGTLQLDILIEDGKIKDLRKDSTNVVASNRIDASGRYVIPGVIDPHSHYGVFTPIEIAARTESRSAAIGGITSIIRMLRLNGSYKKLSDQFRMSALNHHIDYSIHASILTDEQVKDIPFLIHNMNMSSFKVYMNLGIGYNRILMDLDPGNSELNECEVNMNVDLIENILKSCSQENSTIIIHAEDPAICAENTSKQKVFDKSNPKESILQRWSDSRPSISEAVSISRIANLGRRYKSRLYFAHIGSTIALDAIISEKERGNLVTYVETCPHYLTHSTDFSSVKGKVVPPLRSKSDQQSMWYGLRNGIIDTVGTDHVANTLSLKEGKGDLWTALSGFPGMGTMLPVLLSEGVNRDRLTLERLVEVTSYSTARIFDMYPSKGTIMSGSDADLTIIDLEMQKTVTPDLLLSSSDYTIYDGWKLTGWPVMTIVRGRIVMSEGSVDEKTLGHGKLIPRTSFGGREEPGIRRPN